MKYLLVFMFACGGGKTTVVGPSGSGSTVEPPKDDRTEIEKRRDTACDKVGARVTQCALDDIKAAYAEGKVSKKDFEESTTEAILKKHTEKFVEECKVPMTSRQVRVLEVCDREESQCGPFIDCLSHLQDKPAK